MMSSDSRTWLVAQFVGFFAMFPNFSLPQELSWLQVLSSFLARPLRELQVGSFVHRFSMMEGSPGSRSHICS